VTSGAVDQLIVVVVGVGVGVGPLGETVVVIPAGTGV
jgi:hypothetical protein